MTVASIFLRLLSTITVWGWEAVLKCSVMKKIIILLAWTCGKLSRAHPPTYKKLAWPLPSPIPHPLIARSSNSINIHIWDRTTGLWEGPSNDVHTPCNYGQTETLCRLIDVEDISQSWWQFIHSPILVNNEGFLDVQIRQRNKGGKYSMICTSLENPITGNWSPM